MDEMLQVYFEETEELIQKAEECIISLEMEYSPTYVNELFRIAHTIKGSSHMVGYEDIGNLMHKIEDMLDYARNGSITFDQSIVSICFEGIDTVKKILISKREPDFNEDIIQLVNSASRISEKVDSFISVGKKEEKVAAPQSDTGIVSSLLNAKPKGKNKFYISFFIEDDAPMISPILMMIFNSVKDIGTLEYSSISDEYFSSNFHDKNIKILNIIICTDVEEADLNSYFTIFYVEKIDIVDLIKNKQNDVSFNVNGRNLIRTFKPDKDNFINNFKSYIELINLNSVLIILIDTSELTIIHEYEIKELIQIKKQLKSQEVGMGIIVNSLKTKRIYNIFEAISFIEKFNIYENQMDAMINSIKNEESSFKINKIAKEVYHGIHK
ncbi:Hpt domain-containing protein [Ruminiclostridium herbifermentans]|uniref:Hpt domain-containing protein n=1 Tax=Ruminiclostridium herbifermentans TaxID=2488810 RepID=A0A4U7JLR6_9FIRM|nr:Hpt domain-containing protein [Ruminiclostridium herbifermentans]QNU66131.1 Hpt domain-containing protein [Ruminiclostridium herbifermentans]